MTIYVAQAIVNLSLYKYVIIISPFSLKGQTGLISGQKESQKKLDFDCCATKVQLFLSSFLSRLSNQRFYDLMWLSTVEQEAKFCGAGPSHPQGYVLCTRQRLKTTQD